jgi:hypothetical protein
VCNQAGGEGEEPQRRKEMLILKAMFMWKSWRWCYLSLIPQCDRVPEENHKDAMWKYKDESGSGNFVVPFGGLEKIL